MGQRSGGLDLAHAVVRHGIELAMGELGHEHGVYPNTAKAKRPDWMRQEDWLPCACTKCYHCRQKICTGVAHPQRFGSGKRKTSPSSPPAQTQQHSTEERLGKGRCDVCFYTFKSNDVVGIYNYDQLQQMCTSTLVGCLGCGGLRICKGCAPTYKHDLLKPPWGPAVKKQRLS